ncbi:MAG: metallophosphoesterase [Firmicutes bacterium]|nr:metallophosphoesterase [Bacillota bacterium]
MDFYSRQIEKALQDAPSVPLADHPRIALFSDCHRGCGTWNDSFLQNKPLYMAAMKYYYQEGYTCIELGDGDELWENRKMQDIFRIHSDVFLLLTEFQKAGRLFLLWGNHDRAKSAKRFSLSSRAAFPVLSPLFSEGLILQGKDGCPDLHLIHGHQTDLLNNQLWPVARWMVRYLWKPLELAGVNDPTSAAKNYSRKNLSEQRMTRWTAQHGKILIAGHTHRPALSMDPASLYYNTGSCVHPGSVTCLELVFGQLTLVKWTTCVDARRYFFVCREILAGPKNLCRFPS